MVTRRAPSPYSKSATDKKPTWHLVQNIHVVTVQQKEEHLKQLSKQYYLI